MGTDAVTADRQQAGLFERFADFLSTAIGTPAVFMLALGIVLVWALLGPSAGFSDTWQLIINTGTTIVTFLMVFLLANSSNRITENQERMLAGIYDEQQRLDAEELLIQKLLERMDAQHVRPILRHLDKQDHQIEGIAQRILEALANPDAPPSPSA
jgi:low affinity Fe/Cu permease